MSIVQAKQWLRWVVAVQLGTVQGLAAAPGSFGGDPPPGAQSPQEQPLTVLAASSLQDVLPAVARVWERAGGGPVRFSFDATSRLAPQLFRGAPADVFISADVDWMSWLEERGSIDPASVRPVATNRLVFVVPFAAAVGPRDARGVADSRLRRIALAGEDVPAGRYAKDALDLSGTWDAVQDRIVRGGAYAARWSGWPEARPTGVSSTEATRWPRTGSGLRFEFPGEDSPAVGVPGGCDRRVA